MGTFHEAVIVGGGPAGLTAGIYLRRAGIDVLLLEKGVVGGTPLQAERIENYPGFPEGISGRELMERIVEQGRQFGLIMREISPVARITKNGDHFSVTTGNENIESLGVIVSTGTTPIKLGVPGEAEFQGRGVSYCATCDGWFFADMDVAVIGGGDAAIEEGLTLANTVRKVYVVHRRDGLRAQKILQERAFANSRIEFLWDKIPVRISGKDEVESIALEDTLSREITEVPVSAVFVYVGSRADTAFAGDLVDRDTAGYVRSGEDLSTRTEGLFVAGDIRVKSLRQVATAVGDGALAAVNLEHYILEKRAPLPSGMRPKDLKEGLLS
jgi:thioredoxin reductase (NADPH)